MKSTLIAYRAAWELTRNPALKILYISSTANLAIKQLKFIKDILTNDTYRSYWPDMVNKDEMKREKWSEREISVDHPKRKEEMVREPSIFTAGLTTNIVGLHCDIMIADDIVVADNAYIEEQREKVKVQFGYLSSVQGTEARLWYVGTRYHPNDLYSDLAGMEIEHYDPATGELISREPLFEIYEKSVESAGDGTGEFIWPKTKNPDGKWFGFDIEVLATKRAQYSNKSHFRAQYYNDPNDVENAAIGRGLFQYYEPGYLSFRAGKWYFKESVLNVFASVDFAYSLGKHADYSAIVVIGVDGDRNFYILEIDRFKTDVPSEYYKRILNLFQKWGFRKIRAEVSVAQKVIVKDLQENYIRKNGLSLAIDEYRPSKWQGAKEERIIATLEPKYANKQIWHYKGGYCQALEEELIFTNPAHDDIKDALASAVDLAIAPVNFFRTNKAKQPVFQFHNRFGGTL